MAGLNLGVGANVGARAQSYYGSDSAPTTATQAAFGTANTVSAGPSALTPTHPAGVALWVGLAGVVFLVGLYYTLPG